MLYSFEDIINIRDIQHYLYCKHRWGLLKIGSIWAENYYVTRADLLHSRVHNPSNSYTFRGKKTFTSVSVYNDNPEYNLFGVLDCLEASKADDGIEIPGLKGKFKLCIVEYKPTMPKGKNYNEDDVLQVFAQKVCVDHIFSCDCNAVIYYADVKKRISLPFDTKYKEYNQRLIQALGDMRNLLKQGNIPNREQGQKCSGCSLKNACLPVNRKTYKSMKDRIKEGIKCENY